MAATSPGQQLNDLLVTRNFDPEALDAKTGKPPLDDQGAPDPDRADMYTFDWVADSGKNYGTVVCLLGADNNFEVYFGDNLGRSMESDDKANWYEFLDQLRNFAKRNLLRYDLQNLRRLKYTMAGMAAIKEGLFEGYYGNRRVSYAGEPTQARLMIKHNRTLGENDARHRYVESLFIETAEGERFRLPFRKLAGGRAMLEHVRQGGTPYDARGQHIVEMVEQINVLGQFRRAHQGRVFEGAAGELIAETDQYLTQLRDNLKTVSHSRGYSQYFESWTPADVSEGDLIVEDLRSLFVETRVDPRIEQALPMLAKIQKEAQAMKEADIFESWATRITEGTWALPDTPEQQDQLKQLMSQPLPVGADGMNATEQLYGLVGDDELFDIIGDIAETDPDANCWDDPRVQNRLEELGVYMVSPAQPATATETPPAVTEGNPYDLPGIDYDRPGDIKPRPRPHMPPRSPRGHPDDPDFMDPDQRRLRKEQERIRQAWAADKAKKGVAEGLPNQEEISLRGRPVDINTIEIDGVDRRDHPDYADAYISYAEYTDGTELNEYELDMLNNEYGDLVNQMANDSYMDSWDDMRDAAGGYERESKEFAEGREDLHIPGSDKMSDDERHQAIMAKHPEAKRVGKTPGHYRTKSGDLISGIRGVRKLAKEGDNLATFESSSCNMTAEGEYCPEHGLAECGNYGMYESELARIKSLALRK